MAGFNKVILVGNMTRDVEIRTLPSGSMLGSFGIAINRRIRLQTGEERDEVCFVDCTAFDRRADLLRQYTRKGSLVLVEGRLRLDSWTDKTTGQPRSKLAVVVENVQLLDRRDPNAQQQGGWGQAPQQGGYQQQGGWGQAPQQGGYQQQGGWGQAPQQGGYQQQGGWGQAPQQSYQPPAFTPPAFQPPPAAVPAQQLQQFGGASVPPPPPPFEPPVDSAPAEQVQGADAAPAPNDDLPF